MVSVCLLTLSLFVESATAELSEWAFVGKEAFEEEVTKFFVTKLAPMKILHVSFSAFDRCPRNQSNPYGVSKVRMKVSCPQEDASGCGLHRTSGDITEVMIVDCQFAAEIVGYAVGRPLAVLCYQNSSSSTEEIPAGGLCKKWRYPGTELPQLQVPEHLKSPHSHVLLYQTTNLESFSGYGSNSHGVNTAHWKQNSYERTGFSGKGKLAQFGANSAVYLHTYGITKVLVEDTDDYTALPQFWVKRGKVDDDLLMRKLLKLNMYCLDEMIKAMVKTKQRLHTGYLRNKHNTDNAWIEGDIVHLHDETGGCFTPYPIHAEVKSRQYRWLALPYFITPIVFARSFSVCGLNRIGEDVTEIMIVECQFAGGAGRLVAALCYQNNMKTCGQSMEELPTPTGVLCKKWRYPGTELPRLEVPEHLKSPHSYILFYNPADMESFYGYRSSKDEFGRPKWPKNPYERTGFAGRGKLPEFGPNQALYILITRHTYGTTKLLIEDTDDYVGLPQFWVKKGKIDGALLMKKLLVLNEYCLDPMIKRMVETQKLYHIGYLKNKHNTDNAWLNGTIIHVLDETGGCFTPYPVHTEVLAGQYRWQVLPYFTTAKEFAQFFLATADRREWPPPTRHEFEDGAKRFFRRKLSPIKILDFIFSGFDTCPFKGKGPYGVGKARLKVSCPYQNASVCGLNRIGEDVTEIMIVECQFAGGAGRLVAALCYQNNMKTCGQSMEELPTPTGVLCKKWRYPGTELPRLEVPEHLKSPHSYILFYNPADMESFYGYRSSKDEFGRPKWPKNPYERTGFAGRGKLPEFGPNQALYILITRHTYGTTKLLIEDTDDYVGLPQFWVKKGKIDGALLMKKLLVLNEYCLDPMIKRMVETQKLYHIGYLKNKHNTDNAWLNGTIIHVLDETGGCFTPYPVHTEVLAGQYRWQVLPYFTTAKEFAQFFVANYNVIHPLAHVMRYAITITAVLAISFPMMRTATAKSILFMPAMAGASPSHVKSMIPLAENLLKDGHNVSMVQYYNEDREKVTHDTIHFIYMLISGRKLIDEEQQSTIWGTRGKDPWMIVKIASRASAACLRSMHTEGQKQFYKKLSAFNWDLLIVDNLFQPCGIIFSTNTKGQAWIDYSTTLLLKYVRRFRAVSVPPSVDLSPLVMEVFQPTIFKNRFLTSIELVLEYAVSFGLAVAMTTPWRGEGAMFSTKHVSNFHTNAVYSLASLSSKLDIALPQSMNTFSMDYACPKAAKLSREYQNFVEDPSSNGTIVFSFGHIADWKEAPIELIKAVSSAFESLSQYRIVWQFNGNVSTVSSSRHLRIEPWIPLPSLLQHPKTVLFITHSGMKSFREAICFTVPMVSIPLFGDQVRNTILTKFHGLGVSLDKTQLTEESLYKTILNVLHDGGYKRRITKLSAMLSDNLMDETAKGSFWISFYLRHPKSASHMRLKGATMTSVSYHSYDILTFICLAITLIAMLAISFNIKKTVKGKSILFMPAMGIPSHVKSMIPLAENLVKNGHNVSLVQYYEEESEKVTHDTIHFIYLFVSGGKLIDEEQQITIWRRRGMNPWAFAKTAWKTSAACLRSTYTEAQKEFYQKLSTLNWDLLIVDNLFQPCGIVFSTNTKGQAWIDYSTTPMLRHIRRVRAVGVPPSVDLSPIVMDEFQPLNFKNRLFSIFELILEHSLKLSFAFAMTTPWRAEGEIFSGKNVLDFHINAVYSLGSLSSKLDIALPQSMNTFSTDYACPKAAKLSHEYQNFVEDPSSNGTIVFSFGHIADWKEAPIELIKAVSSAFESLSQYRIVWQFNGNLSIVSSSPHLRIEPWIPLPSLLQHPKTVLFITHSGMKSFREAVCFTVPMVSIPLFGDQVRNTILTKFHRLGVSLDKTQLTEESFHKAILNVLHDGSYKHRITKLSAMLSDTLIDGTAEGGFWISAFLRHPNIASHIHVKGTSMTFLSLHSFDVLAFIKRVALLKVTTDYGEATKKDTACAVSVPPCTSSQGKA
ncbi:hypothetical protein M514_10991 [Trichuris suis]|uniref:glucuronosyltransferase n=1 Tax=Trichuris suis TaxID=68888 RepID=A0A085MWY4_9BILA|nr:hypothetical protein M514_10991 [Trichuris suis]